MAWKVRDGYFEVSPGTGDIVTNQSFGDCQLHIEWATPNPAHGIDQEPGNSGVYLQSLYEIQVLESYHNKTYADGQAGAVYCQYPPLANPSLPPGEWQTYDIIFHGPRFAADSKLQEPATLTMLFNGVLAQDHVVLTGPTDYMHRRLQLDVSLDMDAAVGTHGKGGADRLLHLGQAQRDGDDFGCLAGFLEAYGLLDADFVERVHGHLDVGRLDAGSVSLDPNLDVEVDDALDRDQDLHGI